MDDMEQDKEKTSTQTTDGQSPQDAQKQIKSEKRYKTALLLMTCIVGVLITLLIGIMVIQHKAAQQTVYFSEICETEINRLVEPDSMPDKININTAAEAELARIPGIGEVRARDIVTYRNEYGIFTQPEDLLKIHGIGEATLQKMLPYIVFSDDE